VLVRRGKKKGGREVKTWSYPPIGKREEKKKKGGGKRVHLLFFSGDLPNIFEPERGEKEEKRKREKRKGGMFA